MLFFSLLFPLQQTLLCSAVEEVSVLSYYIVTSFWDVRWFLHEFDSGKHIIVHWHMKSEVSNHVCGCPCGRLMEQHYPGPHLETFLHTFWHDWSNYTQNTRHDRRSKEVWGVGVRESTQLQLEFWSTSLLQRNSFSPQIMNVGQSCAPFRTIHCLSICGTVSGRVLLPCHISGAGRTWLGPSWGSDYHSWYTIRLTSHSP